MSAARREAATVTACFVAYGAIFFDRLAPLFIVSAIASDLGAVSEVEGTVALLVGVGFAAAMPFVRATSGRWSDDGRVIMALLVTAGVGSISAAVGNWWLFIALRGLAGLTAGTGAPALNVLAFRAASPNRRGRAVGIVLSSTRWVGSFIAPAVVVTVAAHAGWRVALCLSAAFVAASALLLRTLVGSRTTTPPAAEPFTLRAGGRRNLVLCGVACTVLLAWLTIWSQSSVSLLTTWLDVTWQTAGGLVAVFGIGAGVASLAAPAASDHIGRRSALGLTVGIGAAGAIALGALTERGIVPPHPVVILVILACGVAMGGLPLVLSLIPAEAVASGDVGRALLGPIIAAELLGAAAVPAVAAAAATTVGMSSVVLTTGFAVAALTFVAAGLRPTPGTTFVN